MFYIKKDEENRTAIHILDEVIKAHFVQKAEKETELFTKYSSEDISNEEIYNTEEEIKAIENKIAGIVYARDYVKLVLKDVL